MDYLQAMMLAVVEGITEFLPISSTGHLILVSRILRVAQTEFVKSFEIVIQLGAILAVVCVYFKAVIKNVKVWKRVMVAFVPTGVIGFLAYPFVKNYLLGNDTVVVWSLFWGGVAMVVAEKLMRSKDKKIGAVEELSLGRAALVGGVQALSIIPGVSRAMATIFGGMAVGLDRKRATEFSFLLAVPTMVAATGLDLVKTRWLFTSKEYVMLMIGFGGAFICALMTIKYLIAFVQKHSFAAFAVYRMVLAVGFWLIYR